MAHAPFGAQAVLLQHRTNELIGVETALHQRLHLAKISHGGCTVGGRMTMQGRLHGVAREVDSKLLGQTSKPALRGHKDWLNHAGLGRQNSAAQGALIAGVNHRTPHRLHALGQASEVIKPIGRLKHSKPWRIGQWTNMLGRGGQHRSLAVQHGLAMLVHDTAGQLHRALLVILGQHLHRGRDRVTHKHRLHETEGLAQVDGARPWEARSQNGGDDRARPHAVAHDLLHHRLARKNRVEVGRVGVSRHGRKGTNVVCSEGSRQGHLLAHPNLCVGGVLDLFFGHVLLRPSCCSQRRHRWSGRSCPMRLGCKGRL